MTNYGLTFPFLPGLLPSGAGEADGPDLSGTVPTGIPDVSVKPGVVLNDSMRGFLEELSKRLPFPVVVTSGVRTPEEQASEMMQTPGGAAGITSLYRGAAGAEVAAAFPGGYSAVLNVLESQIGRGTYVSRHMRGDALDFRTRGLSSAEKTLLTTTLRSMGVEVLDEGDHIHIEGLGSMWSTAIQTAQQVVVPVIIASSLAAVGLGAVWYLTREEG